MSYDGHYDIKDLAMSWGERDELMMKRRKTGLDAESCRKVVGPRER
jgi:hypothetical protein